MLSVKYQCLSYFIQMNANHDTLQTNVPTRSIHFLLWMEIKKKCLWFKSVNILTKITRLPTNQFSVSLEMYLKYINIVCWQYVDPRVVSDKFICTMFVYPMNLQCFHLIPSFRCIEGYCDICYTWTLLHRRYNAN